MQYGFTAILGFLCMLLLLGKFTHHAFSKRGLVFGLFIVPPAVIGGFIGLLWFGVMDNIDPAITADLGRGLEDVKINLINFVFAALILGLTW
jgi:Na+/glutamate symporter